MFFKSPTRMLLLVSLMALAGCSSKSDWPKLSDKMPDPASRNRVIERADASVAPRAQDQAPTTLAEAEALFTAVTADIETARGSYAKALKAFSDSGPNDSDKVHLWLEAQLALTRLSQTASRLDVILFNEKLVSSQIGGHSLELKGRIDTEVIAARQSLAVQKPDTIS